MRGPRAEGVYKGRPATIDPKEVRRLRREGLGATEIAKRLGNHARHMLSAIRDLEDRFVEAALNDAKGSNAVLN